VILALSRLACFEAYPRTKLRAELEFPKVGS